MTRTPPPQAQQDPNRSHVIYERWEIPLDIDGRDSVIAGDLTWAPAPPLWPWVGLTLLAFPRRHRAARSRGWRPSAAVLAAIGTAALVIDTAGFVAAINDNLANKTWAFVYAVVCLLATVRLVVHARRRTPDPTLAMMTAGLVLAGMGGLDRFDVLTSGFYQSELDITAARIATITCLAIGLALLSRFLRFLIPLLVNRPPTTTGIITHDAPTALQVGLNAHERQPPDHLTVHPVAPLLPVTGHVGPHAGHHVLTRSIGTAGGRIGSHQRTTGGQHLVGLSPHHRAHH